MSSLGIWAVQMRMSQSRLQTGSWIDEKNGETGWEGKREGRTGRVLLWAPTSDGRIWVLGVTLEQSGLTSQVVCSRKKGEFAFQGWSVRGNKYRCRKTGPEPFNTSLTSNPKLVQMTPAQVWGKSVKWRMYGNFNHLYALAQWVELPAHDEELL